MSLFDSFTDGDGTALDAHVSDGGANWVKHPKFAASDAVILSDAAALGSGVTSAYLLDQATSSADIILTGTLIAGTASTGSQTAYILFRASSAGAAYMVGIQSNGTMRLISIDANGALHSVGAVALATFTLQPGASSLFKMVVRGSEFRLFIDKVLYGIWDDTTYPDAGRIGLYFSASAAATLADGIRVDALSAAPAGAIPTGALVANFAGDDGASILDYVSDSGHMFMRHIASGASGVPTIRGNALATVGGDNRYIADWVPPSADYPVIGTFAFRAANTQNWWLMGRVGEDAKTYYYFGYQSGIGLRMVKMVAGAQTVLGSTYAFTPVVGHSYELRLEMQGSTITGSIDGTVAISVTDSAITEAGKAGFYLAGGAAITDDSSGTVLDSLTTASSSFTIDVADYRVFQMSQIGGDTALALSGAVPSGAADVQLRVRDADTAAVLVDWTVPTGFANAVTGWTGALAVPNGGWYLLDMRWRDGAGTVQATQSAVSHFGVGLLIASTGDSNPNYEYAGGSATTTAKLALMTRDTPGSWALQTTTGYGLAKLADALDAEFGVPIGSMNFAQGGSTLDAWASDTAGNTTIFANQLKANGPVLCWISQVGYNDCSQNLFATRDEQLGKFETMISFVRGIAGDIGPGGAVLPVLIVGSASNYSKADPAPALSVLNRQAELLVAREADNHYTISQAGVKIDGVHKTYDADGWGAFSAQMARMLSAFIHGQPLPRLRITGARIVDATHTDLIVTHTGGDDLTPASGIDYVRIYDADLSSQLAVSGAVRQSATSIRVTHAPGDTARRGFDYLNTPDAGEDWASVPRDNDAVAPMALEMTMDQASARHLVITATDSAGTSADLPVDLMTGQ